MQAKSSEDVIPLNTLKVNPGKVVSQVNDTRSPVLLTSRGRGVAVVQALSDYEKTMEAVQLGKAVAQGLADIREGNTVTLAEATRLLGTE